MTDENARRLRALYREVGESGIAQVRAEYGRLFAGAPRLDQILVSAWTEGRELAGQRYDYTMQCWRDGAGE